MPLAFQLAWHHQGEGISIKPYKIGLFGIVDKDQLVLSAPKDWSLCIAAQALSVGDGDHELRHGFAVSSHLSEVLWDHLYVLSAQIEGQPSAGIVP